MEASAAEANTLDDSYPVAADVQDEEPRGELEQAVAQLWQEVFHLEKIGRNANFFELGGNSLLGMNLSEQFAVQLSADVPVLLIFQHPSIRELAEILGSE